MMNRSLSQKMRFFTFFCISLLVYVHGYNLVPGYLQPFSILQEKLSATAFIEYLFANGLLRFRIPLLFLISGYLYAMYDYKPYGGRTKKRFITLVVPYFIWSAVGLLLTFTLQQFPFTAKLVASANIDQLGDNRPYTEIGWQGILWRWVFAPISFQLWFILALFVYNLFYPFFRLMVAKFPYVWFPLTFLLWFVFFNFRYVEGQGLFFFSIGIWLQKKNINVEEKPKWFAQGLFWIIFIGACIVKTFMAFELDPAQLSSYVIIGSLYNIATVSGILAIWFGFDDVVQWCMNRKWFSNASAFSFFIYGMHIPLMAYLAQFAYKYLQGFPYYRLACYVFVPAITVVLSVIIANLLRKTVPSLYKLLTGGRGI
jgi:fucose 4-O-acetylase-like acetyltransferase